MEIVVLILIAGAVGAWIWYRRGQGARRDGRRLQQIAFGDEASAERLIEAELARSPGISRAEAVRRTVERYERDNR